MQTWLSSEMISIPWTENAKSKEDLKKMRTRKTLISEIRKRQLRLLKHIMRKDGLENVILTGGIEGRSRLNESANNLPDELV